jgi:hypothetical protein
MKTIKFLSKENDTQNETIRYWFSVNGENYCVADKNGELSLLDSEGFPIDSCNDHENILSTLISHYEKMATLKQKTNMVANSLYDYSTIEKFGWADHIDNNRGGLVINMKNSHDVIVNSSETGFKLAYEYDHSQQEKIDIDHLLKWIAE